MKTLISLYTALLVSALLDDQVKIQDRTQVRIEATEIISFNTVKEFDQIIFEAPDDIFFESKTSCGGIQFCQIKNTLLDHEKKSVSCKDVKSASEFKKVSVFACDLKSKTPPEGIQFCLVKSTLQDYQKIRSSSASRTKKTFKRYKL